MEKQVTLERPKIWGGIECTINRVGDEYKDQLEYSGHYDRPGDIEAIAEIGIKTIRYPILWERHQPDKYASIDWSWADRQLEIFRKLGIKPIIGLLHHGSGPSYTNLLDPEFPNHLAAYAYEVACRYPWVRDYTPVNEPLTTARFSGLYGLWYPHHKSELSFYRMLLNQLKGTVLSMEAIRSVNPSAHLIQTEDLGKTFSTPLLTYQSNFENDRRLLTFDILTGRLRQGHLQYEYLLGCGVKKEEIDFFQMRPVSLSVLGLNYYITSERWLDESLDKYPDHTHGGNGVHRYADTEMVRANGQGRSGFKILATEIWDRYHIPLAITEAHLHCTREEQMRWFKKIWDDATELIDSGITIKGVTAWAMLGSFDWDTLLTKTGTQYESGVFDIKSIAGELHPTALAGLITTLVHGKKDLHPVLSGSGWWDPAPPQTISSSKPIMIVKGDSENSFADVDISEVISLFACACNHRRIPHNITTHAGKSSIERINPWAIVNLGSTDKDLPSICHRKKIQYVSLSEHEQDHMVLQIIVEGMPITIHQINKVLDLMIDGDQGCWTFESGEVTLKRQEYLTLSE